MTIIVALSRRAVCRLVFAVLRQIARRASPMQANSTPRCNRSTHTRTHTNTNAHTNATRRNTHEEEQHRKHSFASPANGAKRRTTVRAFCHTWPQDTRPQKRPCIHIFYRKQNLVHLFNFQARGTCGRPACETFAKTNSGNGDPHFRTQSKMKMCISNNSNRKCGWFLEIRYRESIETMWGAPIDMQTGEIQNDVEALLSIGLVP